jgi:hypothetical protein
MTLLTVGNLSHYARPSVLRAACNLPAYKIRDDIGVRMEKASHHGGTMNRERSCIAGIVVRTQLPSNSAVGP